MQHARRSHMSTSTLSCRYEMSRADILTELNSLQERCSTLASALVESSLTTPHHQNGSTLPSPRPIDDGAAMFVSPNDCDLSSGTAPVVSCPELWGLNFAGDLDANFMAQTPQNLLGVMSSEAMLNQGTQAADHLQTDAFLDNNIKNDLQDLFDFNAASLPLAFDVPGMTTSVAESATENRSNLPPTLPSISQPAFDLTVVVPTVSGTQARHRCQSCMKTFRRASDRDRHALSHNPNALRYACPFPGCNRVGRNGFLRRDKLTQHQSHMRH